MINLFETTAGVNRKTTLDDHYFIHSLPFIAKFS